MILFHPQEHGRIEIPITGPASQDHTCITSYDRLRFLWLIMNMREGKIEYLKIV